MSEFIKVSISCITYNQASFVRECLDSLLMQKTNFSFEILIHDDASTDGTREIIEQYVSKYPDLIFPIYQTENQYSKGVRGMMARFNFPRARGKYISLCEGDDYWTDPHKLQKQYDLMERNDQFIFCGHESLILNENNNEDQDYYSERHGIKCEDDKQIVRHDFLQSWCPAHTSSIFFRNVLNFKNDELLDLFSESPVGDRLLLILLSLEGNGYYLSDRMSVYRINSSSTILGFDRKKVIDNNLKIIRVLKKMSSNRGKEDIIFLNALVEKYFDNTIYLLKEAKERGMKRRLLLSNTFSSLFSQKNFFSRIKYTLINW